MPSLGSCRFPAGEVASDSPWNQSGERPGARPVTQGLECPRRRGFPGAAVYVGLREGPRAVSLARFAAFLRPRIRPAGVEAGQGV